MSVTTELIDTLEELTTKLLLKLTHLEQVNANLELELIASQEVIKQQKGLLDSFKANEKTLTIANALLGSTENKRETKLVINSIIREIDFCLKQLSD